MPHINTKNEWPGIMNLFQFSERTAGPMNVLAHVLLFTNKHGLTQAERELAFATASAANDCNFCAGVHSECAKILADHNDDPLLVAEESGTQAPANSRIGVIRHIATTVADLTGELLRTRMGKDVQLARSIGLSDEAIHDLVLIASAACMFNRYVDGLGAPDAPNMYNAIASILTTQGYDNPLP